MQRRKLLRRGAALVMLGMLVTPAAGATAGDQTPDYLGPSALAASPDGQWLYVACSDARQVVWVDAGNGRVVRRVTVPGPPTDLLVTPDGARLIVACGAPQSVLAILEAESGRISARLTAGHTAGGLVLSPDGRFLYVCNRFDNDVSIMELRTGIEVARVPVVREPVAAAVTPDGRRLFVANFLPLRRTDGKFASYVTPVVTVIDTQSRETTEITLPNGSNGLRSICLSPDGKYALVTHLLSNFEMVPFRVDMGWINTNVVSVIDTGALKRLSTIGLDEYDRGTGNPWDARWTADGKWVCVSAAGTHELCYILASDLLGDFARRSMSPMMGVWPIYPSLGQSLWQRIKLPGQGPRGMVAVGTKLYVAEYFSDTIAVVDVERSGDQEVGSIALGPAPQLTDERWGELLFHDATICFQQWQSCASCHPDARVDALNWDLLNDGAGNPKNTKSMLFSHVTPPAMSEGVRETAEHAVRAGLSGILFVNRPETEALAIDVYLKSLQPVPSPYLVDGRLSPAAQRGQLVFERARCHTCHPAPLYTDLKSYNVGSRTPNEYHDRFDTPTLVEVWRTAPYLHDGRYTTIQELMVEGLHGLHNGRGDGLSADDLNDLVEFVLSL